MDIWVNIWTISLVVCCVAFAIMSVWAIIGGWLDLKTMFAELKQQNDKDVEDKRNSV